jgi:uncharacterized protein (DUF983 family)
MTELPASISPGAAGLRAVCPRCGKGALFQNGLVLRKRCSQCQLSYDFANSGDGPAIFAIFILGFFVLGAALIAEFKFGVPVWLHVVLWGLLTPLLAIVLLRWLKATLIALQYRNKAEEGRLAKD